MAASEVAESSMPYIKQDDRDNILVEATKWVPGEELYLCIDFENIKNAGELQYAMAVMFKSFMERKGLNYQNCNDVMGALAGAQMEFYRKVVQPYEDEKIELNGDV